MSITQTTVFLPNILLDETNYPSWFFRLESFLKGQKLYGFVDGTVPCPPPYVLDEIGNSVVNPEYEAWCIQDQSIINMIGQTLSSAATSCAVGSKTSFDLWRNLSNKFAASNRQNILQLKTNLQNLKKGSDSIETFLVKIKVARDALETVGVFMDDEDVIVTVLRGLPSEYAAIKGVIRAQAVTSSISDLKTLLKATKLDIEADSQSAGTLPLTAMVAQATQLLQNAASQSSTVNAPNSSNVSSPQSSQAQSSTVPSQGSLSPVSSQAQYVPIPAIPYGFGPYGFEAMAGFYAGKERVQSSNTNNGSNGGSRASYGRPGNTNTGFGGFNGGHNAGFGGNNAGYSRSGGHLSTCQLCGKVGHVAKTCRTLSQFQNSQNFQKGPNVECQYCGRPYHTADRCFEIIGFPGQQQNNNGGFQLHSGGVQAHNSTGFQGQPNQSHVGTAMMASTSNNPQFWLADSGASNHMTSEVQLLQNLAPYNSRDIVQIGQGNGQSTVQRTE